MSCVVRPRTVRAETHVMFRRGKEGGLVPEVPPVSLMREDNARKGFFEREQLEGILVLLPFHWRSVVRTAYITGWRMARKFSRASGSISI